MSKGKIKNRYVAVAVNHEIIIPEDDSKAPQIEVTCRVVEGDDAGKEFRVFLSLKEGQAQEITMKTLRTMGWKCSDITALEGLGELKFVALEKEEEYKGKMQTRYDIWPLTVRQTLREDDRSNFANRFKAAAAATLAQRPKQTEVNAAPAELPPARESTKSSTATSSDTGSSSDLYA